MKPKVLVRTDFSAKTHLDPSPAQIAKREARKQRKEQVRQTRKDKQEKSETQRSNRTTNIEVNRLRRELHEARLREEQLHRDRIMPLNERLTALENEIARLRNEIIERDRVIHMDEQLTASPRLKPGDSRTHALGFLLRRAVPTREATVT